MILDIIKIFLPAAMDVINRVVPDANERLKIQNELTQKLLENEGQLASAMRDVMVADAQSESWLTRNARPMTVVWSMSIASWIVLIAPAIGITEETLQAIKAVPTELWVMMTVGIGAYPIVKMFERRK
jgi:hypothetical protein